MKQSLAILKEMGIPCGVIINRADMGSDDARNYLKQENIPLLMSVPFDREIAVAYSKGELVTNLNDDWMVKFTELYHAINKQFEAEI